MDDSILQAKVNLKTKECRRGHVGYYYFESSGYARCKACKRINGRLTAKKYYSTVFNKRVFGGNRFACLERDNYSCVECGMTDEEHREKWGRAITVDHIDGRGSNVPMEEKNNSLENLRTLCFVCHGRLDNPRRKTFSNWHIKQKQLLGTG